MKKTNFLLLFFLFSFNIFVSCSSSYGIYHRVRKGDTIYRISKAYNINVDKIKQINNITDATKLKIGDYIFIPGASSPKDVKIVLSQSKRIEKSHKNTQRIQKKIISKKNDKKNNFKSKIEKKDLKKPLFIWPANGVVSSPFGMRNGSMHEGIDIAIPIGTPIKASLGGKIIFADSRGGYGLVIIIQHKNNWITVYAHNSKLLVSQGQTVKQGQTIALSGKTGRATGPHLHFEIRKGIKPLNPLKFLRSRSSHG